MTAHLECERCDEIMVRHDDAEYEWFVWWCENCGLELEGEGK